MDTQGIQSVPQQEDPVSIGKQILAIEAELKRDIGQIQEILVLIVKNKLSLDKIKGMVKEQLQSNDNL